MKNVYVFVLVFIGLGFSSCDRDENRIPVALVGSWETVGLNNYLELDYATTYTFNANGTYTHSSTLRNVGESEDLGYNYFESGNYRIEENQIIFARTEYLHKPYGASKLFYGLDELDKGHVEPNSEGSQAYEIRNNGQELFFPGGIVGGDDIVEDVTFVRVE